MDKNQRKKHIRNISRASGIAQYALEKKISDPDIQKVLPYLDIVNILKKSVTYNRYRQAQRTKAANDKLKSFLDPENSEIVSVGKWLLSSLSLKGKERRDELIKKDVVHKDDYNDMVEEYQDIIDEIENKATESGDELREKMKYMEEANNILRSQLSTIKSYIKNNYGNSVWKDIEKRFDLDE